MSGYKLDDWCSIHGTERESSFRHQVQTGSEAHAVPYPVGRGLSFLVDKAVEA